MRMEQITIEKNYFDWKKFIVTRKKLLRLKKKGIWTKEICFQ